MSPNLDQLIEHRRKLALCNDFESFLKVQIEFVDLVIRLIEKDEEELKESARIILGLSE